MKTEYPKVLTRENDRARLSVPASRILPLRLAAVLSSQLAMVLVVMALAGCARTLAPGVSTKTAKPTPADLSTIRGANYRGSAATNTTDYWLHYHAAETERDLTYADRLKLNQL